MVSYFSNGYFKLFKNIWIFQCFLSLPHLADDLVEKGVERGHNIMCEHITKPPFIISLSYYITFIVRMKDVFVSYFYIFITYLYKFELVFWYFQDVLREDVKEMMKWEVDRSSPSNKIRDFVAWSKDIMNDIKYQTRIMSNPVAAFLITHRLLLNSCWNTLNFN